MKRPKRKKNDEEAVIVQITIGKIEGGPTRVYQYDTTASYHTTNELGRLTEVHILVSRCTSLVLASSSKPLQPAAPPPRNESPRRAPTRVSALLVPPCLLSIALPVIPLVTPLPDQPRYTVLRGAVAAVTAIADAATVVI